MVAQFSVIKLHDCLHGRPPGRGIGTAIMEVELQQQLAWVDQKPLYQIYLNWGGASKSWQGTVSGQICFASKRNYGMMQRWCVARVVIMVSLLRLIVESYRGDLFPASCSMFVSTVLYECGSGMFWV
jgi:hypothetical protein